MLVLLTQRVLILIIFLKTCLKFKEFLLKIVRKFLAKKKSSLVILSGIILAASQIHGCFVVGDLAALNLKSECLKHY